MTIAVGTATTGESTRPATTDGSGHGSHVASIGVSSANSSVNGLLYNGVAPDADLVIVKGFDENGNAVAIEACWSGERAEAGCPAPVQERAWSSAIWYTPPVADGDASERL